MADHGFELVSAIAPAGIDAKAVAVGDVTGDGLDDVLALGGGQSHFRNRVILYAQIANGFAPPVAIDYHPEPTDYYAAGKGLALADLDGDGDLDILVPYGDYPSSELAVLRNDGGAFTVDAFSTTEVLREMRFTDVNGDGHLDLVGNDNYGNIAILHGDGEAGFGQITWHGYNAYPSMFQLADIDGDGREDLVYHAWDVFQVRRNEGTGFAESPRTLVRASFDDRFAVADFRGNGRIDLAHAVGSWPTYSVVLHLQGNDGAYRLKQPLGGGRLVSVDEVLATDLDGDGHQDVLVFTRSFDQALVVRLGRAGGGFSPAVTHELGNTASYALGDVNGDGERDIVLRDASGGISYRAGRNSSLGTDLAVFTGLNAGAAAIRVENRGTLQAAAYKLTFRLEPRLGSVSGGTLPGDCTSQAWNGSLAITCQMPALAAGAHHERQFPFVLTTSAAQTMVTGTARVLYDWPELRTDNNVASKRVLFEASLPPPLSHPHQVKRSQKR
ncbi:FG-GAP repeat domain-containing protein [Luteimonas sp. A649]